MTVVASLELDDEVPGSECPGEPDGAHGRLGSGADEPDLLDGRDSLADLLGHPNLELCGRSEAHPLPRLAYHCIHHFGMTVPEYHWSPREHEVDVSVALAIDEVRAKGLPDEPRSASHLPEGPYRRVYARRYALLGPLEQLSVLHPSSSCHSSWMISSAPCRSSIPGIR
ncbi:MAG: hypothetical protein BWZ01_02968 [Deltaproteobacteria bacterium ADurb.BinA179]|nr:MAG: hypothetical protein BWZ01_02968 [Deltaproteobacteria bacterium ADurb.BinA179]